MLENLRTVLQMANGHKGSPKLTQQQLEEEMVSVERRLEAWTGLKSVDNRVSDKNHFQQTVDVSQGQVTCTYCSISFRDRIELRAHCQTEAHQTMIMSDEGRDWRWRPPPRGYTADVYSACESWAETGVCRYGAQCVEAHGPEELAEWKERFEYRRMKLQRACEKELYGKSYTEQLLERWIQAPSPERVMREKLENVDDSCCGDLVTTMSSKHSKRDWNFVLRTQKQLQAIALLQDAHRNHFNLKQIIPGTGQETNPVELTNDQEWISSSENRDLDVTFEHKVTVTFQTDIYGTFRQSVVFDFGTEPVLVKHLCVDVLPVTDADKIREIKKEIVLSTAERWDSENAEIVAFSSPVPPVIATPVAVAKDSEWERDLLNAYPCPRADTFTLTHSTVAEKRLTRNNYRARMHELLCVEEMARYEQVARYNLTAKLRVTYSYMLAPNGIATSTAKYSHSGELFALMPLGKDISEDTSAGRLILNNCTTVFIAAENSKPNETKQKRKVYEALIEDKGKNMIYLRLPAVCVKDLNLKTDTDFSAEVQFQLNRIPYCEWHYAIDKIADFRVIFPDTYVEPNIPWSPQRQWSDTLDVRLNLKQKEAVVAITTPMTVPLPPILIIGPFGTGKTYTLAQAIKQLLIQSDTRILICTHSNSAADLYIKDYLHPYVEAGHEEARPLRVYYHKRWVATVNQTVQKYCLIELNGGVRNFRVPTLEDIMKHRIVVVTLSISMYLSTMGLPKGHFTHILLDEAAQAMECEAIMPLALADQNTRIVLAGDHMQLSPELFSQFAKERNLHVSLLERLYDHYPSTFPCKILLCENYRAHEAIIHFTSELFYDQKLISSGKQPRHEKFYPLTFFTTRGEDVQDHNSTAFYNNSEVYEVVERVCELKKKWPVAWGKMDDQSIGIMTPYADQVFRIRSELRKRRMGGISVERVLNVQGKQFRAIFLSTVRTRRTCTGSKSGDEVDYGFLSNSKLLNTAITRAQSLVAVVGDPVALCSIGRCRKVWERFIEICNQNKSLFGITWSLLRSQLDGVELKKTYVLNPLAPEFIPRQFQPEAYIKMPPVIAYNSLTAPAAVSQQNIARFTNPPPQPVGPPFVGPPPAPVYPVPPMFFIPSNPHFIPSNQPQIFPIRPPGPPPFVCPPNNTSVNPVNPWGVNYPMPSPSGEGNQKVAWPPVQPLVKKPLEPFADRIQTIMPAQRSPGSIQQPIKNIIPVPPPQNPNTLIDSIVSGEMAIPSQFLSMQNTQKFESPQRISDKEQIQFFHNVHFPERQLEQPSRIYSHEWANLLPPNVTPAEMIMAPQVHQIEWCRHLQERFGTEAANKFIDLLFRAKKAQSEYMSPERNVIDDMFNDKNLDNILPPMQNGHTMLPPRNLFPDIPRNDKPETLNFTKPMYLRDMDTSVLLANLQNNVREEQFTVNNLLGDTMRVPWQNTAPPQQSVPLYRRQGPQPNQIMEQPIEKPVSSNAFSGYARAAINAREQQCSPQIQGLTQQQLNQLQQQQWQRQINAEFAAMKCESETLEDMLNKHNATTYASVLRTNPKPIEEHEKIGDPFAVLRDLGQRSVNQTGPGLYQYFS